MELSKNIYLRSVLEATFNGAEIKEEALNFVIDDTPLDRELLNNAFIESTIQRYQ